jgi:ABC-2 type transport system permease protein
MKQLASSLRRYFRIYKQILSFTLKYMMAYRANFLIRSLHNIFYVLTFFITTLIIYQHTPSLAGWTKNEGILLFSLVHITYGTQTFFFMRGIEEFMRFRIKSGDFDLDLLKPVNSQFMALFRKPWIDSVIFTVIVLLLFIRQISLLSDQITTINFIYFLIAYPLCLLIWYFILAAYATISFHITSAEHVFYFIEKASDFAQYPTTIFPKAVASVFFSVVPIAFVSFVPASILMGRNSQLMWLLIIITLPISFIINRLAWKKGLEHYSSASS